MINLEDLFKMSVCGKICTKCSKFNTLEIIDYP